MIWLLQTFNKYEQLHCYLLSQLINSISVAEVFATALVMCLTDIDVIKREYDLRECSFTHPEMHVNLSSYIFPLRHLRVVFVLQIGANVGHFSRANERVVNPQICANEMRPLIYVLDLFDGGGGWSPQSPPLNPPPLWKISTAISIKHRILATFNIKKRINLSDCMHLSIFHKRESLYMLPKGKFICMLKGKFCVASFCYLTIVILFVSVFFSFTPALKALVSAKFSIFPP
jgi:hypothetical protein